MARLGLLIDQLERAAQQRLLTSGDPSGVGGARGALEHLHPWRAGQRLGLGHAVPQLERPLEQGVRLREGVDPLGRRRGAHGGGERRRLVAGRLPVMGRLRGDEGSGVAGVDAHLERAGQRGVHLGPLARQQVVVHHLAQQRVAEGVGPVRKDHHDLAGGGLAQRVEQLGRLTPHHGSQQLVVGRRLAGQPAQQVLGARGQSLHAQHQGVAQRGGQRPPTVETGGQDLLGEQRIALRARVHALHQPGIGRSGEDPLELLAHLLPGKGRELDHERRGIARELGQQRPQRMASVQLVGAIGPHHQ